MEVDIMDVLLIAGFWISFAAALFITWLLVRW